MSDHYYNRYLDLMHQIQDEDGLDRTTTLALRDAVDAIEDYLSDGDIEHIDAVDEYLRAVWPT